MRGDRLHFTAAQPAVEIFRKACLHIDCSRSSRLLSQGHFDPCQRFRPRAWFGAVSSAFRQARPRTSRDFTVPRLTPSMAATSS